MEDLPNIAIVFVIMAFLFIFMMSILILFLPLNNLRGDCKVKNMIPIVIISGLLLIVMWLCSSLKG